MGKALRGKLMPEVYDGFRFLDSGCDVSPSCLACPLPICKHDDPAWWRRVRAETTKAETCETYEANGRNASRTARELQVALRTVNRRTTAIRGRPTA